MPQMTVLEILNRTKVFFEKKGIPDARLDAEYIISHGLKMKSRMDIYLNFEKPLTDAELDVLRQMVARRANREPLQHIIGDTSFRGFIIKCDKRALVPRPETEMLVDMAKERLKGIETPLIVEVGTGTVRKCSPQTFLKTHFRSPAKMPKPTASAQTPKVRI